MKNIKYILFFLNVILSNIFSQQLPLQIGNQWHYTKGFDTTISYIATAIDTVQIRGKYYYKIERRDANADSIIGITFDRIEGDSLYYRTDEDNESLVFNFNWKSGHIESTRSIYDTTCIFLTMIGRDTTTFWGISTDRYSVIFGYYCLGMQDTDITLSGFDYLKYFGCLIAEDGWLKGAIINNISYGTLFQISDIKDKVENQKYFLSQNYPNPFNPITTINYQIPIEANVNIKIYDCLGNEIKTLVNESKKQGFYMINFDASNLASGIYFYQLKTKDFISTKKMIVLE